MKKDKCYRRIAANRIYTATDVYYDNHIVELADGHIVNICPLKEEQAMTEWVSGILVITDKLITDLGKIRNIQDFYTKTHNNTDIAHQTVELNLYHITGIPYGATDINNAQITKL